MSVVMIVLMILVGLAFLASGGQKLAGSEGQKKDFNRFGYPQWFMYLTGVLEITGAIGMFIGVFVPVWGALAGLLLAVVMAGAVTTHIRVKDSVQNMAPASVLLVLALAVSVIYFLV